MSELAENTEEIEVEVEEAPPAPEVEVEVEKPEEKEFDPSKRVEIKDPEVQRKFNHLYKQVKMSDQRNQLKDQMLEKAMAKIDDLESRWSKTDHAEAEKMLMARYKEAKESGDDDKELKILNELIEFKADQKLQKTKQEKPAEPVKPQGLDALGEDGKYVYSLATETNDAGELVRPWLNEEHPRYRNALKHATLIASELEADTGDVDIADLMDRLDQQMNKKEPPKVQPNKRALDPMRSNLTNKDTRGKIKISADEAAVAKKLGVSLEEYVKWK